MVGSRKLTLLDRIRRAINAFRGKYVGFVVEGSDLKGTLILYECDREKCGDECPNPECNATIDISHAANFELVECMNGLVCYREKSLNFDDAKIEEEPFDEELYSGW